MKKEKIKGMNKVLLVMISLVISASGCHKSVPAYYPVNATVKADFNYKDGTYWVYQDALSGEVDSFVVWDNLDATDQNQSLNYSFEDVTIAMHQYGTYGVATVDIDLIETAIDFYIPYYNYQPLSVYPFQSGAISYTSSDRGYVISILPSYSLNGRVFDSVEEISHIGPAYTQPGTSALTWNDTFYFSPNTGIIKMILNHPQDTTYNQHRVWELLRYNIIK